MVMTGCQENKSCSKVLNFLERLDIYNNFDLCLRIYFFLYIKCGSYLLVELVYLFIRNVVRECNFAF